MLKAGEQRLTLKPDNGQGPDRLRAVLQPYKPEARLPPGREGIPAGCGDPNLA